MDERSELVSAATAAIASDVAAANQPRKRSRQRSKNKGSGEQQTAHLSVPDEITKIASPEKQPSNAHEDESVVGGDVPANHILPINPVLVSSIVHDVDEGPVGVSPLSPNDLGVPCKAGQSEYSGSSLTLSSSSPDSAEHSSGQQGNTDGMAQPQRPRKRQRQSPQMRNAKGGDAQQQQQGATGDISPTSNPAAAKSGSGNSPGTRAAAGVQIHPSSSVGVLDSAPIGVQAGRQSGGSSLAQQTGAGHTTHMNTQHTTQSACGTIPSGSSTPIAQLQQQQEKKFRQSTLVSYGVGLDAATVRREIADRDARIVEMEALLEIAKEDLARFGDELTRRDAGVALAERQSDQLARKLTHYQRFMREEMLQLAKRQRREARRILYDRQFELGQIAAWQSNGQEIWIEGNTPKELILELQELTRKRDEVEAQKKLAEKRLKHTLKIGDEDSAAPDAQEHLMEAEEAAQLYTSKYTAINNAIAAIKQQQADLKSTKKAFVKEIHRISYEDGSEFNAIPAIGDEGRYVLMTLLGKGGYSEVWKAFDVKEGRYVACKIHRVNREWAPQRRAHYLRHAERELEIMRSLDHPRLTKLYDVFEFNQVIFVSVIECCQGTDMDTYLKRNRIMKEGDAKLILLQVVSALRHLASQEKPIIHYDLKPANILFEFDDPSCLEIKITDFGLSKIISGAGNGDGPSDNPSVELTSPGAGTLWYLPPECFDTSGGAKINSKVDVWSCGVIYYQMLYGKLPFADGESQQRIWREKLIVSSARTLEFPDTPKVSNEAKDLIRKCLQPSVMDRYDIVQLSSHPYLLSKRTARIMKAPLGQ